MQLRQEYERREEKFLAPNAAFSSKSRGRKYSEPECEFRSAFQRDRDRIIHSEAFRKLEYKTQVFVNHEGDYYRTRLTHTLEVSQISRGIARSFRLNEDLAEAIALAHDLGHTPFGHSGESALDKLLKNDGGFEHNRQSYRVVTFLEKRYPEFDGLNLTFEVLEGIVKHSGEFDNPNAKDFIDTGYPSIEAQIVNLADEIAYLNHDLDDGLISGLLKFEQLDEVPLWKEIKEGVHKNFPGLKGRLLRHQIVRRLIHLFVNDLQAETLKRIKDRNVNSIEEVRQRGKDLVNFSSGLKSETAKLRAYLHKHLYKHPKVKKMSDTAEIIIEKLFKKYSSDMLLLPSSFQKKVEADGDAKRHIADYIAGMTDRFAMAEYEKV